MKPAISVHNLSKRYRLGVAATKDNNLTENLRYHAKNAWDKIHRLVHPKKDLHHDESFWALKDVSFEAKPGEVVGIIGRNGAGKSTLLKVLSQIVEPTSGHAVVHGRMGSLLEVGTGFHPELTGRENIYMNGAILGMSRMDIKKKFDEIVEFAEVEKFLDTPVKRYSSGMYVRLGFAVAAHLEPEILLVDEVLAVGDASFQAKCIGKLQDVSKSDNLVLFVSHNMAAIKNLCTRCIYLRNGTVDSVGETEAVIRQYYSHITDNDSCSVDLQNHVGRISRNGPVMVQVQLTNSEGTPTHHVPANTGLTISVEFKCKDHRIRPILGVVIKDQYGSAIFGINNRIIPGYLFSHPVSSGIISCEYEALPLAPGTYNIDLYLGNDIVDVDVVIDAVRFSVIHADVFRSGKLPSVGSGPVLVPAKWKLEHKSL